MHTTQLRIGTRGSKLALVQANCVRDALAHAHGLDKNSIEISVIKTTGDRVQDRPLSEIGGKGLFTREIETALLEGAIDMAVHSMKDMPTQLPDGLVIETLMEREDPRDAFLSPVAGSLAALPHGARVGSSSLRRGALIRALRPDLDVVMFRGNVDTRLKKLADGVVDATLLAVAGLNRLGLANQITSPIAVEDMLPAIAQGAVGIEIREGDDRARTLLGPLHHLETERCVAAERAFLAALDGSCQTPIAGYATLADGVISFRGLIVRPDGSQILQTTRSGPQAQAQHLGADAGAELKARGGPDFFKE
ncbi:MAG: hydroxymethylbilane synthase [Alphaproteobacteria bacterium]